MSTIETIQPAYTHEEIAGLAALSEQQLDALNTTFGGLVKMMNSVGVFKEEVPGLAHQSHHLGWDHQLMEELARNPKVLLRAEARLREEHPEATYFILNQNRTVDTAYLD